MSVMTDVATPVLVSSGALASGDVAPREANLAGGEVKASREDAHVVDGVNGAAGAVASDALPPRNSEEDADSSDDEFDHNPFAKMTGRSSRESDTAVGEIPPRVETGLAGSAAGAAVDGVDDDDSAFAMVPGGRTPRRRALRPASEITQEELSSCFHLPSEAACRKLGIGLTVLKRQCRKFGIKRWPFRKMKSLDRLITNVQAGISPGDQNRALVKSVEELEEQKRRMEECQNLDLDEDTKRLQQAFSKANHKARRMAQMPEANGLNGLLALSGKDPNSVGPKSTSGSASPPSNSVDTALNAARAQVELLKGVAGVAESVGNPGGTASAVAAAAAAIGSGAAGSSIVSGSKPSALAARPSGQQLSSFGQLGQGHLSAAAFEEALKKVGADKLLAGEGKLAVVEEALKEVMRATKPIPNPAAPKELEMKPADAAAVVAGRWSPARPARRPWEAQSPPRVEAGRDVGAEMLDELLSRKQSAKRTASESESESESEASEEPPAEEAKGRFGRARRPNLKYQQEEPEKKKKRRVSKADAKTDAKVEGKDDGEGSDPLASLADAALATGLKRGRGRPPGSTKAAAEKKKKEEAAAAEKAAHAAREAAEKAAERAVAEKEAAAAAPSAVPAQRSAFTPAQRDVAGGCPPIDRSTITLLVAEHADRLREHMLEVVGRGDGSTTSVASQRQAVSDVIGVESLKLRDILNALLLSSPR